MSVAFARRTIAILASLVLGLTACSSPPPAPAATPTPSPALAPMDAFMKGISYTSWAHDEYRSPESDRTLSQLIAPLGANWISLLVTRYQDQLSSTNIQIADGTPSDESLSHAIQEAHSLGLRVMLKPHVDVYTGQGRVGINFGQDQAAWATWFANYTSFITHYAALAQQTHADYFVVGTELTGTSSRADQWRTVIVAIRQVYSGPLTYAANWGEESTVNWWSELDAIGVDAYYPVPSGSAVTVDQVTAAWAPHVTSLGQLSQKWKRPIIFTEIGYRSIAGAGRAPADTQADGPVNLQEQATNYQAVFNALKGQAWWHGVFWWNWTPSTTQGGPLDKNFTAHNKPAEDVLRRNFGATTGAQATP